MWLGPGGFRIIIAAMILIFAVIVFLVLDEVYVQKCLKCRKRIFRRRESGYCPVCEELVKRERKTRYYRNA